MVKITYAIQEYREMKQCSNCKYCVSASSATHYWCTKFESMIYLRWTGCTMWNLKDEKYDSENHS